MTPKKYRKKPVVIEAMELRIDTLFDVAAWCNGDAHSEREPGALAIWVDIPTLEGVMRADRGDYIIRGVKGEFYPCKPDIFAATYEEEP